LVVDLLKICTMKVNKFKLNKSIYIINK